MQIDRRWWDETRGQETFFFYPELSKEKSDKEASSLLVKSLGFHQEELDSWREWEKNRLFSAEVADWESSLYLLVQDP